MRNRALKRPEALSDVAPLPEFPSSASTAAPSAESQPHTVASYAQISSPHHPPASARTLTAAGGLTVTPGPLLTGRSYRSASTRRGSSTRNFVNQKSLTRTRTAFSNDPFATLNSNTGRSWQQVNTPTSGERHRDVRDIFALRSTPQRRESKPILEGVADSADVRPVGAGEEKALEDQEQKTQQKKAVIRGGDKGTDGHSHGAEDGRNPSLTLLLRSIAALGVIYGDIGTSPLYTFKEVIHHQVITEGVVPTEDEVLGALSNMLYCLILVVCVKYCGFVLRADYNMEGGTFALYQRVMCVREKLSGVQQTVLLCLTCAGASLLLGESVITPAISILAALEGITVQVPSFEQYIIYVALVILILLFLFQSRGTEKVGIAFGPIMIVWFCSIAAIGVYNLASYGAAPLRAFSPVVLVRWWSEGYYAKGEGLKATASIVLTVTGAEAMFADMGHFGRSPIYVSWFCMVFPCLILQYLGQAAYILEFVSNPNAGLTLAEKQEIAEQVFWRSVPRGSPVVFYGMLVIATLATVVASQALITGAFTLMSQASALEILPRLNVVHTSLIQRGQVYIGTINFVLMVLCCTLVVTFQSSSNLAAAYGCAVTSVFFITTIILCFFVAPYIWHFPWFICFAMFLFQGTIDAILLSATYLKVPYGGWFPLLLATILLSIMGIWKAGKTLSDEAYLRDKKIALEMSPELKTDLCSVEDLRLSLFSQHINRGTGIAIFLTPEQHEIPMAMLKLVSRLGVLPQYVLLANIEISSEPFVFAEDRVSALVVDGEMQIYSFIIHYGWAEPLSEVNIPLFLREAVVLVKEIEELLPQELAELLKSFELTNKGSSLILRTDQERERDDGLERGEEDKINKGGRPRSKPVSLFVNSNIAKAATERGFLMRTVIQSFSVLKRLFSSSPVEFFNLPANSTTEVGNVLFL